jgi:hypothetical protein
MVFFLVFKRELDGRGEATLGGGVAVLWTCGGSTAAEGEGTPGPAGGMPFGSEVLECVLDGGNLGWKLVAD